MPSTRLTTGDSSRLTHWRKPCGLTLGPLGAEPAEAVQPRRPSAARPSAEARSAGRRRQRRATSAVRPATAPRQAKDTRRADLSIRGIALRNSDKVAQPSDDRQRAAYYSPRQRGAARAPGSTPDAHSLPTRAGWLPAPAKGPAEYERITYRPFISESIPEHAFHMENFSFPHTRLPDWERARRSQAAQALRRAAHAVPAVCAKAAIFLSPGDSGSRLSALHWLLWR